MKKLIKKILPNNILVALRRVSNSYFDGFYRKSYSQEGEDLILMRLFESKKNGFYIDVGAHHPKRFSNTYLFYKKGWRGINIDAMPNSMDAFNRVRPNDINIEVPISDQSKLMTYYAFNEPALNGFSKELSDAREGVDDYRITFTKKLETKTLDEVLMDNLPKNQTIDFVSIDVEGLDFQVLKSFSLDSYKPSVVLLEILGSSIEDVCSTEIYRYLKQRNYSLFAKSVNTVFFKLNKEIE